MAVSEYDKKHLSSSQQKEIQRVTEAAQSGKMSWSDAHSAAESIRSSAGYSGGKNGAGYTAKSGGGSGGSSRGSYAGVSYERSNGSGIYGVPVSNSTVKNYRQGGVTYQVGPDMSRRQDLAGQKLISNGYTVSYDKDGYATGATKGVIDYTPHRDSNARGGGYSGGGAWTDNELLSAADQAQIAAIRARLQRGEISGDQANAEANAIRAGYGYTIDKSGYVTDSGALSGVNARRRRMGLSADEGGDALEVYRELMGQNDGGEEYGGSRRGSIMDAALAQLLGMNYTDWTKGDDYRALAERYGEKGRMGMQDTLGQISSRTGGLASSYATTAAQQQYNSYMSQLEEVARQMYDSERGDLAENVQLARQLEQDAYSRQQDALSRSDAEREAAQERIGAYLSVGGKADQLDAALIAASGLSAAELAAMENYYASQQAAKVRSSGGSGSGGGGSTGMKLSVAKDMAAEGIFTQEVLDAFHSAGYGDEYLSSKYGYEPARAEGGYNSSNFNAAMSSIRSMLEQGRTGTLRSGISSMWEKLSDAQKEAVQRLLAEYGISY